jgi:hypothetical protein
MSAQEVQNMATDKESEVTLQEVLDMMKEAKKEGYFIPAGQWADDLNKRAQEVLDMDNEFFGRPVEEDKKDEQPEDYWQWFHKKVLGCVSEDARTWPDVQPLPLPERHKEVTFDPGVLRPYRGAGRPVDEVYVELQARKDLMKLENDLAIQALEKCVYGFPRVYPVLQCLSLEPKLSDPTATVEEIREAVCKYDESYARCAAAGLVPSRLKASDFEVVFPEDKVKRPDGTLKRPLLQQILDLLEIQKIQQASAEGFWKGAFPPCPAEKETPKETEEPCEPDYIVDNQSGGYSIEPIDLPIIHEDHPKPPAE